MEQDRDRRIKYIEKERIPKPEGNVMAAMLFSTISNYFADPQHQKEFEEWQRSRKKSEDRRERNE